MSINKLKASQLLAIEIVLILALTELVIIVLLDHLNLPLQHVFLALLDATLLFIFATPILIWRIRAHALSADPALQTTDAPAEELRKIRIVAVILFLAGSAAAILSAWYVHRQTVADGTRRFDRQVRVIETQTQASFDKAQLGLKSLVGIYAADGGFRRDKFRSYWAARGYNEDFRGIRGFGVIDRTPRTQLQTFTSRERRDGAPAFEVKTSGIKPDMYVIRLIEPIEGNRPAEGLDIASEPVRFAGAQQALRSAQPTLTGVITLKQDATQGPGFLLLMPLYKGGPVPPTVEMRESLHTGFVYCPIAAAELFAPISDLTAGQVEFEIYSEGGDRPVLVYDSRAHHSSVGGTLTAHTLQTGKFSRENLLTIAGQTFRLRAGSTAAFDAAVFQGRALIIGFGGLVLSLLVALAFWLLASGRLRAEARAKEMTRVLTTIIENVPGGLSAFDADLHLVLHNRRFGELLELPAPLLTKQPVTFESIIRFNAERGEYGPGDTEAIVAAIVERARHPVPHVLERTRPNGTTLEIRGLPLPGGGFVTTYTDITDRKRLEHDLMASEDMLERAGQIAGIGSWTLDLADNRLQWSQKTRQIHEVPVDFEPTLDNAIAFYTPEAQEEIRRLVERAVTQNVGFDTELELITATGRHIWVRSVGEAEFMDGKPWRLIGAFQDITLRRQLEQQVREQNELLTAVLENMPGGLVVFDKNLTLVMRNRQFGALLNFPESIFNHTPVRYEDLIRNEAERGEFGSATVEETVSKALANARHARERVFERTRPNGQILEVRTQPMASGGVLFMLIDITQRKLAERAARHADEMLRKAINSLDEAFVIYDDHDRLLISNQKYRDTYPISAAVMTPGTPFEEIIRYGAERGEFALARGRVDEWVKERIAQHQRADSDLIQELADGRYLRIVERKTSDGYIVGFRIDITPLVRARMAAEEASKSKSQFLANMSHEIRTPMNAILGMLDLLGATELSVRQRDYVDKTHSAAESLLGLLNDILDFSKVEAGKMTLEAAPFRLDKLLHDLSVILSSNACRKPVEVLFDIDPKLPSSVVGDSLRLKQILINLGGNALKFTEQGTVVLRIAVLGSQPGRVTLAFSVQDTGIGISPENLQRIFEGFSQAEASTTRRFGGTGLGLAISSRLVGVMGGQLKVESELGKGSRFFFHINLPVAADATQIIEPPSQAADRALQVLIIDDNPAAQQVLRGMIEPMGWQADCASSGEQALELIRARLGSEKRGYDAVFVDWQMPGMDGWQTSLEIRRLLAGREASILVMVTAYGREMLVRRPANEQSLLNGFLVKPVTPSMVLDAVMDARHGAKPTISAVAMAPRRLAGMRILVVEDNKINQQIAQELLQREGALVTLADNGELGVQAIAETPSAWDVVLMDVQMPVMDGYTATRQVRTTLGLSELPIIAMTANAMEADRQDALSAGMNAHVGKPFKLDELVETILEKTGHAPSGPSHHTPADHAVPSPHAAEASALDTELALRYLGGDANLLAKISLSFASDLMKQIDDLNGLLSDGKRNEAMRMLHTLKSSAATVGATRLATLAGAQERQLRDGGRPDSRDLSELHAAAVVVKAALDARTPPVSETPDSGPASESATAPDRASLRVDLEALLLLLRNSDLDSLDVYQHLRDRLSTDTAPEISALDRAMERLDFLEAARLCGVILSQYTPT